MGIDSAADDAALVEPARQQVIGLAAVVVGRLPAEAVPPTLRAIARFTPAKRQRLGSVALAAALDGNDDFRERVADAVAESSPELVAAVRSGAPTAAADPIDVAIAVYLTRPDGWRTTLGEANRRWATDRAAESSSDEELTRLRVELAASKAERRAEPARLRAAVATATDELQTAVADLRRALRDRTRDLRVAERHRDEARRAEKDQRAQRERHESSHEAELRRTRSRIGELERVAEAGRRESRGARDIDDARLWLLVDTVVQAANGIRRELPLPPPDVRPADAVPSGGDGAEPGGRSAADPAALDRLLALPNVHVIVDGYNVTKTGYGDLPLIEQRSRLVGSLAPLAAQSGAEITVAFDGAVRPAVQPPAPRGIRVLFSAADEIADDLIRRLVSAEPPGRAVVVVTSDRQVVTDTGRDGAWAVPSAVLLTRLG